MVKKIFFSVMFIGLLSSSAFALLTPKLLAKFSYGYDLKKEHKESHKIGGGLAFELEFIRYLSAGVFLSGSSSSTFDVNLQTSSVANANRTQVKAALIDVGLYIKPQLPLDFGAATITPYVSFAVGIPSFSVIHGEHSEKYNNTVLSQFYSGFIGVDFTFADHWMLLAEVGVAANIRRSQPHFVLVPLSGNVGLGYRF